MRKWTSADENEFRRMLAVRMEIDASFSGYFFDQSLVYVFLAPGQTKTGFVSNLVHETGHARLADSPLGLLHQILFELAARCGERLHATVVEPVFQKHIRRPESNELANTERLIVGEKRSAEIRDRERKIANEAFSSAQSELVEQLSAKIHEPVLALFRRIQERRRFLIGSSPVCHEAVAMFHQCGSHPSVVERYRKLAAIVGADASTTVFEEESRAHIENLRQTISGRWQEGLERAERLVTATGTPRALYLAAKLAHHVPCVDFALLSGEGFQEIAASTALHVDRRFLTLCENADLLKGLASSKATPIPIKNIQDQLLSTGEPPISLKPVDHFADWIVRLLEDSLVQNVPGIADDIKATLRSYPVVSPYASMHVTKSIVPPILLADGRIIGGPPQANVLLKHDFIRAEKVRIVERILKRMMN